MNKRLQNNKYILLLLLTFFMGKGTVWADDSDPISFADSNVKALCVANWGSNGELSYDEASAVTSIGTVFKGNTSITSFNELQYFSSLASIEERAFMGCTALAEITIPENVATIGDKAFVNCPSLATVHFNAINCTSMSTVYNNENYSVFMSNTTTFPLTNLTISNSVQSIPDYAFRGCNQIQNLTIPASVTTVGNYAFYECADFETLNISGGAIGEYAFFGCSNLETLTIGEGVTSIGNYAFWNCPVLTTVNFNAINCTSMGEVREEFFDDHIWTLQFYCVFNSGLSHEYPSPIVNLTIGDNVTRIPDCAFCGCSGLTGSLTIPNSVTTIGDYAFINCTFTGNLILGNSVTTIGAGAFECCRGFIGDLVIPNSVISICGEDYTYYPNPSDPSLIRHEYHGAFKECSGFTGNLNIPNAVTTIGAAAFAYCNGFTGSLNIPNSVTMIGDYAFEECSGFTDNLTIGNSVTSIGYGAFFNCSSFTGNLTIGNSVTTIEEMAFFDCRSFTGSLTIPNSVIWIGGDAFYGCSGFKGSLVIPNSVTEIGYDAFKGCSGFDGALIIGRNVNTIYDGAFYGCNGFTTIISETSATPIPGPRYNFTGDYIYESFPEGLFYGMNQNIPVYVPVGQISDYQNDEQEQWSYFTNYVNQVNFEKDGNDRWSDEFNWSSWEVPTSEDVVCITDNCQLDTDANVLYVYMADDEKVLTVNSGKTLTTTYGVGTQSPSQLVITDGSQLIANNPVQGVVQKHIDAFTSADDGWNFIASPVTTPLTTANVSGLIPSGATVYDLYYLNEENTKWFNYKALDGNADPGFDIVHKRGYLYSNGAGTTINFSGTLQPYVESGVTINLAREGDGWNLVGNPFTFNAYVNKSYFVINGRNVEVYTGSAPIAPCTGIVVKATGDNETVTFTKDNPIANSNQGNLNIVVAEQLAARDVTSTASAIVDKAIVSFNEGCQLEKFVFNEGKAKLYIPQGQEEFAIATSEYCGEMPVNFRANENGQYTITVNPEDVEMGYLHLIDNMSGADIDLLDTPSYTFNAKTRDYASRFRLVFASVCKDVDGDNAAFAYYNGSEWVITNGEKATLMVFDAMGHIVISGDEINRVSTNGMAPGVYVLRLIQDNNVKTQKIVVR